MLILSPFIQHTVPNYLIYVVFEALGGGIFGFKEAAQYNEGVPTYGDEGVVELGEDIRQFGLHYLGPRRLDTVLVTRDHLDKRRSVAVDSGRQE